MKYSALVIGTCLAASLITAPTADAASTKRKPKPFKPTADQLFEAHSNPAFRCALKGSGWVFGKLDSRRGIFRTVREEQARLRDLMKRASGSAKKKLQRQLAELRSANKEVGAACAAGPQPRATPTPEPTPEPTPLPDAISLAPLTRALTTDDVRYLAEKAAYGLGSREESRLVPLIGQGVAAVVNDLITERAEDQRFIDRVIDRRDGNLGNGGATNAAMTLNGIRQSLLEEAIGTDNPYLDNFKHFLFSIFTAGCEELVGASNNLPSQFPLCIQYWQLIKDGARNPLLPDLLVEVGRDTNMLMYLDNAGNIRGNVNENYAREVLELFSMSPERKENGQPVANYIEERDNGDRTQGDIYRVAQAFSGWRIAALPGAGNNLEWRSVYSQQDHIPGPHIMFEGTPHQFLAENDEDVVRGVFQRHPGVAPYFAREMLEWYLTPEPPEELVVQLAQVIKDNNFNLREPMRALLSSRAFYAPEYKNKVLKTSFARFVEFVRTLGLVPNLTGPANQERGVHIANREGDLRNANGMQFDTVIPPSVFYYPKETWRSTGVLLGWLNTMGNVLADTTSQNNNSFTPLAALPAAGATADQVISHVAARLGVELSASQRQQLLFFMNNNANANGTFTAAAYNHANTTMQRNKGLMLYMIIGALPQFILK